MKTKQTQKKAKKLCKHMRRPFDEVPESYKMWMLGKIAEGGSRHLQSLRLCLHYLLELQERE